MYIQLYQIHGLIRAQNLELGKDEDTGGQIVYIVELANALANIPEVTRVEIVTRLFKDENYPGYSLPFEQMNEKVGIVRVPCGPSRYLKKVELWNYLNEFYENILYYLETDDQTPDIIHSNYGDAGYVCDLIAQKLDIPHIFSAHSLGKPKFEDLKACFYDEDELNLTYNFAKRIQAEQNSIKNAQALLISCEQEKNDQFSSYDVNLDDDRFKIILPGVNVKRFRPFWDKRISQDENQCEVRKRLADKINSGLSEPEKPCIFMLSRLESKKNTSNMVECYCDDPELQKRANLILCTGKISVRSRLSSHQLQTIDYIERLIRFNNLQDKVYIFDEVDYETEVPELYRIVGRKKGIFVDCDLTDPLPLTIIEAAMSGIPVVANCNCALLNVIAKGKSELLINVRKHHLLAEAITKLLDNSDLWDACSVNGVEAITNSLTWEIMANNIYEVYEEVIANYSAVKK